MSLALPHASSPTPRPQSGSRGLVLGATAAERQRAYRRARWHTGIVRLLRLLLPFGALASLGLYAMPHKFRLDVIPGAPPLTFENVSLSTDNLKMKRPSFDGFTPDGAHYKVGAATAIQNFGLTTKTVPGGTEDVALDKIEARLTQVDESWVNMTSATGIMRIKPQTMRLDGGIDVTTSQGMTVKLASADVDFKAKQLVSDAAVVINMPAGRVTAKGLDVDVDGKIIVFRSAVVANLNGNGAPPQPSSTPRPGAFADLESQSGPIDITAARLEIRDAEKTAQFSGGVVAQRTDSRLTGASMTVTYANREGAATGAAALAGGAPADIEKLRVDGAVRLTSADGRAASANQLTYDRPAGMLSLIGNVAVSQAGNLLRGGRVDIDLNARHTRVTGPGRVMGHFEQAATEAATPKPIRPSSAVLPGTGDSSGPIEVEADQLDVFDEKGLATFRGNVLAERAGQVIKAGQLDLAYSPGAANDSTAGNGTNTSAASRLRRMEARDRVSVRSKDGQVVSGDHLVYEAGASVIAVNGNVVVNNSKSVATVDQLLIDLNSGEIRFNGPSSSRPAAGTNKPKPGRVQVLIDTSDAKTLQQPFSSPESSTSAPQRAVAKPAQKSTKKTSKPAVPTEPLPTQP